MTTETSRYLNVDLLTLSWFYWNVARRSWLERDAILGGGG